MLHNTLLVINLVRWKFGEQQTWRPSVLLLHKLEALMEYRKTLYVVGKILCTGSHCLATRDPMERTVEPELMQE